MTHPSEKEPLRSIIRNVERLLTDADILLEKGSAGSAMSLAILAFEESGKGHHWELSFPGRSRRVGSWHHYRQYVAAYVMQTSLFQKYKLEVPPLSQRAQQIIEERWSGAKSAREVARQPIPEEFRAEMRSRNIPGLEALDRDQKLILSVELRWVGKVMKAAAQGIIEEQRQRGMYVDLSGDDVTSSPLAIKRKEAFYWMRVAQRALSLLRHGEYREPYGELGAYLETLPKPLPSMPELLKMMLQMQKWSAEMEEELAKAGLD